MAAIGPMIPDVLKRLPPQPSGIEPQFLPWAAHEVGVQPQRLGVPPPPQVCGADYLRAVSRRLLLGFRRSEIHHRFGPVHPER